ncbi:hypothetical protein Tco_1315037 [Tanacetum coccineum]
MGSLKTPGSKKGVMMLKRVVAIMLNEIIVAPNQKENDETTRTLFMDFFEKSQESDVSECNSLLTCEGFGASMWPIQVNPSTSDELKGDINNEDYEDVGDEGLDKLCEEMSNISVSKVTAKFTRKHTRFVYNSDGELAGELESSSKTEEERVDDYVIQSFERGIDACDSRAFAWEIAHVEVPGPRGRPSTIIHNDDDLGKAINRNDAILMLQSYGSCGQLSRTTVAVLLPAIHLA